MNTQKTRQQLRQELKSLQKKINDLQIEKKNEKTKYQQLFNNLNSAVVVYEAVANGKDFIFKNFNRAAEKIENIEREDLLGKSVLEIFPSVKEFGLLEVFQRVWKTGKPEHYPVSFYKDERIAGWRNNYVYKLPSDEIVAVYEDITEQKKAEEELRNTKDKFQYVFEASNIGKSITYPSGEVHVNKAFSDMLGYEQEELQNKTWQELTPLDEVERSQKIIDPLLKGEKHSVRFVKQYLHKDGAILWADVSTRIRRDSDGNPVYFVTSVVDVTERKQAEATLQESQRQLSTLMSNLPGMAYRCKNIHNWTMQFISDGSLELTGYKPQELIADKVTSYNHIIHPEDRAKVWGTIQKALQQKKHYELKYRIITKANQEKWVWERGMCIAAKNNKPAILEGFISDINQSKQAEEKLSEEQNRLEYIMEATKTHFNILDSDYNIHHIDKAWQKIYGNPGKKKCYQYFMNLDSPCSGCGVKEALTTKKVVVSEEFLPKENRYIEVHTIPFQNKNGKWLVAEFNIDITEHKKSEQSLRQSEAKFRSLIESSNDGICLQDMQGKIVFANKRKVELLGYDDEKQLLGKNVLNILKETEKQRFMELMPILLEKGFLNNIETEVIKSDGSALSVVLNFRVIRDENGNPQNIMDTMRDITERKQAQSHLHLQSLLLNQIQDCVTMTDLNGVITYINEAEIQSLGYSRDELIGATTEKYGENPEQGAKQLEIIEKTLKHGKWRGEVVNKSVEGKEVIMDCRTQVILDEQGNKVALVGISTDITERKQAKHDLMASEARYRRLFEAARDGILILDAKTGIIEDVNPYLIEKLGFSREEFCGKMLWELGFFKDIVSNKANLIELQKKKYIRYEDLPLETADGRRLYVEFVSNVYLVDNHKVIQCNIRDITQRKQAEVILRESENKFRNLAENTSDLIATMDLNGDIIYISQSIKEDTGFSKDEVEGKNIKMLLTPESYDHAMKLLQERLTGNRNTAPFEVDFIDKSGQRIPYECNTSSIVENEKITNFQIVARNITQRKQAEEEIQTQTAYLARLFESAPEAIVILDNEDKIQKINPEFTKIFGYTTEEVLGKKINNLVVPAELKKEGSEVTKAVLKGNSIELETIRQHKNGKKIFVSILGSPIKLRRKQLGVYGIYRNITERKEAEETLRLNKEKLLSIFRVAPTGIGVVKKRILSEVNPRVCEMTGYSSEELIGQSASILYPTQEDFEYVGKEKYAQIAKHGTGIVETRWQRKDGTVMDILLASTAMNVKDLTQGVIFTALDITERKQMQLKQETLFKISEALNRTYDLIELCDTIRTLLGQVMDTTNFMVALYDEQKDTMSLPFNIDLKDDFKSFPAGKTLTKYVIDTAKPLLVKQAEMDKMTQAGTIESIGTLSKIWLGVPLIVGKKVIGVIALQSYDDPDLYSKEDIGIISFVSEEIALAIKRTRAEEQIRRDLNEKNILLKELYHRTKNNMQVIASMLKMQARQAGDAKLMESYREIINRINSMAGVHQKLYESKDLSMINLKDYIVQMIRDLRRSYWKKGTKIEVVYDLQEVFITIDAAIPLSLVLTELISNIFKHAFPTGGTGKIKIMLKPDAEQNIVLELTDNGVGIAADLDLRKVGSMGLETVFNLVEYQLDGNIEYSSQDGLKWHIVFSHDTSIVRV